MKVNDSNTLSAFPLAALLRTRLWPLRRQFAGALLCMLGVTVADLLTPWPLKWLFDEVLLQRSVPTAGASWASGWQAAFYAWLHTQRSTAVVALALSMLVLAVLQSAFAYGQQLLVSRIGQELVHTLRAELFAHLQHLPLTFHNRARTGELLAKVTGETEALKDGLIEAVLQTLGHGFSIAAMLLVLLWLDWRLSLISLATFPLLLFTLTRVYERLKVTTRQQRQREGQLAARLGEVLGAIRLVKAEGREAAEHARFTAESAQTLAEGLRTERLAAASARIVELLKAASLCATVLFGVRAVLTGRLTPGALLVFIAYLNELHRPLRNLAKASSRLSRATVSWQRIHELLQLAPEHWAPEQLPATVAPAAIIPRGDTAALTARTSVVSLRGAIRFERVSFYYDDPPTANTEPRASAPPALHDLSFAIAAGERVAFVGASGAGKSTVANLLLRLYHASTGTIWLDDRPLETYPRAILRQQIGVVLQDAFLFGATIRANIAYGKPEATEAAILAAAEAAHAHEFISALPAGYDTVIGERGSTLSGGQRQRICLARALLKDPAILILDEPTSAVDAQSAHLIYAALDEVRRAKTTIVIAHQLAALAAFDRIFVLEQGRLIEQGTHADLLQARGAYFRLLQHQALPRLVSE